MLIHIYAGQLAEQRDHTRRANLLALDHPDFKVTDTTFHYISLTIDQSTLRKYLHAVLISPTITVYAGKTLTEKVIVSEPILITAQHSFL